MAAVLWWAVRRGLDDGLRWALIGGLLIDLLSSGPLGVNVMALLLAMILAASARSTLLGEPPLVFLTLEAALAVFVAAQTGALMLSGWNLGGLHSLASRLEIQLLWGAVALALLWWPLRSLDNWIGRPAVPEF